METFQPWPSATEYVENISNEQLVNKEKGKGRVRSLVGIHQILNKEIERIETGVHRQKNYRDTIAYICPFIIWIDIQRFHKTDKWKTIIR